LLLQSQLQRKASCKMWLLLLSCQPVTPLSGVTRVYM
jgi:hypothetical protein